MDLKTYKPHKQTIGIVLLSLAFMFWGGIVIFYSIRDIAYIFIKTTEDTLFNYFSIIILYFTHCIAFFCGVGLLMLKNWARILAPILPLVIIMAHIKSLTSYYYEIDDLLENIALLIPWIIFYIITSVFLSKQSVKKNFTK